MHNRFASLFIAALLPLLLFQWFVPEPVGQIDFWLLWIVAMVTVGLPLLYAEIGLAHRSQRIPVQGIQELTRQADTGRGWRSFAWLTVLMALVVAALSVDAVSASLMRVFNEVGIILDVPQFAMAAVMVVLAGILSLLGRSTLMVGVLLVGIAYILGSIANVSTLAFVMTDANLAEWGRAMALALVSVGVGSGLYWFSSPLISSEVGSVDEEQAKKMRVVASKTVLPIWLTQLLIGSFAIVFSTRFGLGHNAGTFTVVATLTYALGVLAAAAFFIHYASSQLAMIFARFGIWIATGISIFITAAMVVLTTPSVLSGVLLGVSVIGALILAIFAGWQMKISHMRKSLNFASEGIYNLWRVAIRILAPLLIIVGVVGWFVS